MSKKVTIMLTDDQIAAVEQAVAEPEARGDAAGAEQSEEDPLVIALREMDEEFGPLTEEDFALVDEQLARLKQQRLLRRQSRSA